jgi:hypothetical protein
MHTRTSVCLHPQFTPCGIWERFVSRQHLLSQVQRLPCLSSRLASLTTIFQQTQKSRRICKRCSVDHTGVTPSSSTIHPQFIHCAIWDEFVSCLKCCFPRLENRIIRTQSRVHFPLMESVPAIEHAIVFHELLHLVVDIDRWGSGIVSITH